MTDVIVHIVLAQCEHPSTALNEIERSFDLRDVDMERWRFLGIATGRMPAEAVSALRASGLLESVKVDGEVSALEGKS